MSTSTSAFGEILRRLRTAVALSQEELAARSGLSTRGISDLERGVRRAPHLETVRLLADALGLVADDRSALLAAARPSPRSGRATPVTPDSNSSLAAPAHPPRRSRRGICGTQSALGSRGCPVCYRDGTGWDRQDAAGDCRRCGNGAATLPMGSST